MYYFYKVVLQVYAFLRNYSGSQIVYFKVYGITMVAGM